METYLQVLDFQANDIEKGDMERFTAHSQLEAELIDRLESLQRVIRPLRRDTSSKASEGLSSEELQRIDEEFSRKTEEASKKNRRNQEIIRKELLHLRGQMDQLRRFSARTGVSYGGGSRRSGSPRYIDLEQ